MDKDLARSLLALATSMDPIFHEMFATIERITDDDVKRSLKQSVGLALQNITVGVIFSVEKLFPDLKVD